MAQGISGAQSKAISSGFLSRLGTNDEFIPQESLSSLIQLAAMLVENAQTNLHSSGQVSSGALSDSFKVLNPQNVGGVIKLEIEALNYFDFQNKGVRGTGGGGSSGNYSFKNNFPSSDMVKSITTWLRRAGASTTNVNPKHTISKQETKNVAISEYDRAYGVAMAIKIHGIKGTGYLDKAIKVAQAYSSDILGHALAIDIIGSLPKKLDNGNSNKK